MTSTSPASIALITGASRGLGQSTALHLAQAGTDLLFTYRRDEAEARATAARIEKLGRTVRFLRLDVGDSASFPAFAAEVHRVLQETWGRPRFDFLVNNAGIASSASVTETTEAQFDELYRIHLKGTFFLTQQLLPLLADGGRIVNLSTSITRYSFPGAAAYAAMKGAVEVLTRYLALELGPRRITVNSVAPGGIATDIGGGMLRDPALQQSVASITALGRMGQPEDIGGVVAMLLGPGAGWINGQRIEVNGGVTL